MIKNLIKVSVVFLLLGCSSVNEDSSEKVTKYVDPTIGNVSRFLGA